MKRFVRLAFISVLGLLALSCAKKAEQAAPQAATPEAAPEASAPSHARVEPKMLTAWMIGLVNRHPGRSAHAEHALGEGVMQVQTPDASQSWAEMVDADSNGTKEKIVFMWDGKNKVMYAYTHDPITLAGGTMADQGLMVAQFAERNSKDRPVGSGWYAYALSRDTTATNEAQGTLFGCTFDRTGAEQECGVGTWKRDGNEFSLKGGPQ